MKKLVIGILAHVDAGKTTLSEALLYRSGARRTLGRVAPLLRGRVSESRFVWQKQKRSAAALSVTERFCLSGKRDSNPRPLAPHASALPDCATARCLEYRALCSAATGAVYTQFLGLSTHFFHDMIFFMI